MMPLKRQKKIITLIETHGLISFNDLCNLMDVSHMTIRRDAKELEKLGKIAIVHGGVCLVNSKDAVENKEEAADILKPTKKFINQDKKFLIAQEAIKLIGFENTVFLDAGSTGYEIALQLLHRNDLTIVTNCFFISSLLCIKSSCKIIHIGGTVSKVSRSCIGDIAAHNLERYSFDVGFIASSYWNDSEIYTSDEDKVIFKQKIKSRSKKVYLTCDSSKYGTSSLFKIIDLKELDGVITDAALSQKAIENLEEKKINLYLAMNGEAK